MLRGSGTYKQLVDKINQPDSPLHSSENELDKLLVLVQERRAKQHLSANEDSPDRIQQLRELTIRELIPVFAEMKEKYAASDVNLEMDASNFLSGGREIKFHFQVGEYRLELGGTVTTEAIAFHETRYAPDVEGEFVSGPMLRLHRLDVKVFREFICERMAVLMRTVLRQR